MKKILCSIMLVFSLLGMAIPVQIDAAEALPLVVDDADLLSDSEESALLTKLDEISTRQAMDVVVVTAATLGGKSPMAYADDFFDYNGYGQGSNDDGVLLLVSMEDRDWWISTHAYGITAFTDAGISYIGEQITPYLSDADYDTAFTKYADLCDEFITEAKAGHPYDTGNMPKGPFDILFSLAIAAGIGIVIAFIAVSVMAGKLKTVRPQSAAHSYIKDGSMDVRTSRDIYLYHKVTRRAKPKNNGGGSSTHSSSSGRSHGGGGGKF